MKVRFENLGFQKVTKSNHSKIYSIPLREYKYNNKISNNFVETTKI